MLERTRTTLAADLTTGLEFALQRQLASIRSGYFCYNMGQIDSLCLRLDAYGDTSVRFALAQLVLIGLMP